MLYYWVCLELESSLAQSTSLETTGIFALMAAEKVKKMFLMYDHGNARKRVIAQVRVQTPFTRLQKSWTHQA
jgi:hypothetical protein